MTLSPPPPNPVPSPVGPPPAAPPAPRPVRRSAPRRLLLGALLFAVLAGIIVTVFALDRLVGSLHPGTTLAQSATGADLPDCAEEYPEWIQDWVDDALPAIRDEYGPNETALVTAWSTPPEFPAAAFGWAGAVPDCGSMMIVDSTAEVWTTRLDVDSIDKAQFTAISTSLTALGYLLTFDQVPHEFLSIDGEQQEDADAGEDQSGDSEGASWFREFSSETGTVSLTFFPDDASAANPSGELVVAYFQPID